MLSRRQASPRATVPSKLPRHFSSHQTLSGFHQRAITAVSFSRDGRHLASLGCDDDHSLAIYDWANSLLRVRNIRGDEMNYR